MIIESGVDKNKNNILDSLEIDQKQTVCNGVSAEQDSVIFLPIPNASSNTTSVNPVITGDLIKFKKSNYPGVDSIIFVASPYVGDITNSSVVDLYDITDRQTIVGSSLSSNSLFNSDFIQSGNLFNNISDKEITLGISQHSSNQGFFAASGTAYLFLYRH